MFGKYGRTGSAILAEPSSAKKVQFGRNRVQSITSNPVYICTTSRCRRDHCQVILLVHTVPPLACHLNGMLEGSHVVHGCLGQKKNKSYFFQHSQCSRIHGCHGCLHLSSASSHQHQFTDSRIHGFTDVLGRKKIRVFFPT